jgi:hypothetical protein
MSGPLRCVSTAEVARPSQCVVISAAKIPASRKGREKRGTRLSMYDRANVSRLEQTSRFLRSTLV